MAERGAAGRARPQGRTREGVRERRPADEGSRKAVKLARTARFARDFRSLPPDIQGRAAKQFQLLLDNPRHPSLRIKKMEGTQDIWEGRITKAYRFTFQVHHDTYILRRIGAHDILGTP